MKDIKLLGKKILFGGILFSKEVFEGDVMFSFTIGTVLPATRDVNALFCAKWDDTTSLYQYKPSTEVRMIAGSIGGHTQ